MPSKRKACSCSNRSCKRCQDERIRQNNTAANEYFQDCRTDAREIEAARLASQNLNAEVELAVPASQTPPPPWQPVSWAFDISTLPLARPATSNSSTIQMQRSSPATDIVRPESQSEAVNTVSLLELCTALRDVVTDEAFRSIMQAMTLLHQTFDRPVPIEENLRLISRLISTHQINRLRLHGTVIAQLRRFRAERRSA